LPADQANPLREKILQVLVNNGIGDPAGVLRAVRLQAIENEKSDPGLPSHLWWNRALLQEAASDFLGKVNHSFDNAMARASQAFKLKAASVACVLSFLVAFSIGLDSLALLQRLSMDDKFRDSLVNEARSLVERIEKAEAKAKAAQENKEEENEAEQEAEKAKAARDEIDATLALLRQPRFAIIPDAFLWEKVAQGTVCPAGTANWAGTLHVGRQEYKLTAGSGLSAYTLEKAILELRAPVYVYRVSDNDRQCLRIVARATSPDPGYLKLIPAPDGSSQRIDFSPAHDLEGARRRFAGVLLSAVLLSLGTPFWFNLLKRLLSLRSILARKDDQERSERETQLPAPQTTAPAAPTADPAKATQAMEGEMGDLERTGAVG
jgi:hypothetical protein